MADLELLPAILMLDDENETPDDIDNEADENTYKFGIMAGHNVVLATCPQGMTGNVNVSNITGPLSKTFPNIRITLLVGIGGGVPQPDKFSDPINDVRLGDVVVGWPTSASGTGAVVYHEYGRSKVDGFEITGSLDRPHAVLLKALPFLKVDHIRSRTTFHEHMAKLQDNPLLGKQFIYPGLEHDLLFESTYKHAGGDKSGCADCDGGKLVKREPRSESDKERFIYHQGRIATGNSVIMDGILRDSINKKCNGALCIEMEAAGADVNGRVLIIRGISDYADSHKSDLWRPYAAAKAVAFARELLGRIPAREVRDKMAAG